MTNSISLSGAKPIARGAYLLALSLFTSPVLGVTVGSTTGEFSVTPSGTASYVIPITIPPGAGGMAPQMSVTYDSGRGNGYMGMGFGVTGTSAITRCPVREVTDGFNRSVRNDSGDQYCLDGQRLILISGVLGANGSEYRKEFDDFTKVTAHGGAAGNPQHWIAKTKSGLEMSFGSSADSRVHANNSAFVRVWALERTEDTAGNFFTMSYHENYTTGEHYLESVAYSGNTNASVPARNRIDLTYQSRSDTETWYEVGAKVSMTRRVSRITTYVDGNGNPGSGTPVRQLRINYDYGGIGDRSQVRSITECAYQGGWDCLNPTKFEWMGATGNGQITTAISTGHCANNSHAAGKCDEVDNHFTIQNPDINGDGRQDLCYRGDHGINCFLSTGSGFGHQIPTPYCANGTHTAGICNDGDNYSTIAYPDINADGKADLCYRGDQGINCFLSTGTSFGQHISTGICANSSGAYGRCDSQDNHNLIFYPDINGDGRADICYRGDHGIHCYRSTGTGFEPAVSTSICNNATSCSGYIAFADMDLDGMSDLLYRAGAGIRVMRSDGTSFTQMYQSSFCGRNSGCSGSSNGSGFSGTINHMMGNGTLNKATPDVNGDGYPDLCFRYTSGIRCGLTSGVGVTDEIHTNICADGSGAHGICNDDDNYKTIGFGEFDGDGKADLYYRSDGGIRVWRSTGTGFSQIHVTSVCANGSHANGRCNDEDNHYTLRLADITGNGMAEVIFRSDSGFRAMSFGEQPSGWIDRIESGFGAEIEISYQPITSSAVYRDRSNAVYPQMDFQTPTYVVSKHETTNGIGGKRRVSYIYEGMKLEHRGRGSVGFAKVEKRDHATEMATTTTYSQTFPFIGLATESCTETFAGALTNCANTEYASKSLTIGGYTRYIVHPTIERSIEYDPSNPGTVLATTTIQNQYTNTWTGHDVSESTTRIFRGSDLVGDVRHTTVNTNTYFPPDTQRWHLGRLKTATVRKTSSNDVTSESRLSSFEYESATGLLFAETIEPNRPQHRLRTEYVRDAFGNIKTQNVIGITTSGTESRLSGTAYESKGRFPLVQTNPLGHRSILETDARYGNVTRITDANDLVTNFQFDAWGRSIGSTFNQHGVSNSTQIVRRFCGVGVTCRAPTASHYVRTTDEQGQVSIVEFDVLERQVRQASLNPNDKYVETYTEYDAAGRVARTSAPRFENSGQTYWTSYLYDDVGRVVREEAPLDENLSGTKVTRFEYDGFVTRQFDPRDNQTTREVDVRGLLTVVTDHNSGVMTKLYDAWGHTRVVTSPGGAVTTMDYDVRGQKIAMSDPNMGSWRYTYDAFGQMHRQQDAKNQVAEMRFDRLGRMTYRDDDSGQTTWVYDSAWKGALTETHTNDTSRKYTYSAFGAVDSETVSIAQSPALVAAGSYPSDAAIAIPEFEPSNANPTTAESFTIEWTVFNGASCQASGSLPGWSGAKNADGGRQTFRIDRRGSYRAALQCFDEEGRSRSRSFTVEVDQACDTEEAQNACDLTGFNHSISAVIDAVREQAASYCHYADQYDLAERYEVMDVIDCEAIIGLGDQLPPVPDPGSTLPPIPDLIALVEAQYVLPDLSSRPAEVIIAPPIHTEPSVTVQWTRHMTEPCPLIFVAHCRESVEYVLYTSETPGFEFQREIYRGPSTQAVAPLHTDGFPLQIDETYFKVVAHVSQQARHIAGEHEKEYSHTYRYGALRTSYIGGFGGGAQSTGGATLGLTPFATTSSSTTSSQSSSSPGWLTRTTFWTHDASGRINETIHPNGHTVKHHYDRGQLSKISDSNSGFNYWVASTWDHWGQVDVAAYGNGLTNRVFRDQADGLTSAVLLERSNSTQVQSLNYRWDATNNLAYREDDSVNANETFIYDGLNRLSGSTSNVAGSRTIRYSADGNITSKTGQGNYVYDSSRPHAVRQRTGQDSYTYDANGNMVTGGSKSIVWTAFNKPSRISRDNTFSDFLYGPSREKVRHYSSGPSSGDRAIYYFAAGYEEHHRSGNRVEEKVHISTPDGATVIVTTGSTTKLTYAHPDHLGSTDAVTSVTGAVIQRLSYSAFGSRRSSQWDGDATSDYHETQWGFTGHEMLDDLGLIHMQGRVYDPDIGRFLSPDPFVQFPDNPQSLNRYSYVLNNPLSATDPTGYFLDRIYKEVKRWERSFRHEIRRADSLLGTAVRIVAVTACAAATKGAGTTACVGATEGLISRSQGVTSGSQIGANAIRAAITYAVGAELNTALSTTGATSRQIVQAYIGFGVLGGINSVASGGEFGAGFAAGVVSAGTSGYIPEDPIFGTVVSAVVGGTTAEIAGGKFANGAVTGAFSYALRSGMANWGHQHGQGETNRPSNRFVRGALDVVGKIWALPNTVLGLVAGGLGYGAGWVGYGLGLTDMAPGITFGNNAIQFHNIPSPFGGALTLGNTIIYSGGAQPSDMGNWYGDSRQLNLGRHEKGHTYQAQAYGPLFLPVYFLSGGVSASNPFERSANDFAAGGDWRP